MSNRTKAILSLAAIVVGMTIIFRHFDIGLFRSHAATLIRRGQ